MKEVQKIANQPVKNQPTIQRPPKDKTPKPIKAPTPNMRTLMPIIRQVSPAVVPVNLMFHFFVKSDKFILGSV